MLGKHAKSIVFQYTCSEHLETELKNRVSLQQLKKLRFGIYRTKHTQDLYDQSNQILMKKIEDLNKWRDILCSRIGNTEHNKDVNFLKIYTQAESSSY